MIDFTRAFDSAWERMQVILFRPFDIGKWFAIGLSAFLAGLIQGGNGFNSSFNSNSDFNKLRHPGTVEVHTSSPSLHDMIGKVLTPFAAMQLGVIVLIIAGIFLVIIGISLLLSWLGARGQFMFLDNIVRNRGAIAWPWTTYARQANSFFLFYLLFILVSFAIFIPILAVVVVMCVPLYREDRWPTGPEWGGFAALGIVYFLVSIALTIFVFLFREFGVPIMFRNGLTARPALAETMKVVSRHAGSVAVFVLLRIAIFIGVVIISVIVCCLTCCIGLLPYIGTVFLLPVLIYVKCFTLDCLAQFGPEYDVFTVDVPTGPAPGAFPLGGSYPPNPPPPPG